MQITPCPPFVFRKRSTDGATPNWVADNQLQLTTRLSTLKGQKAELAWLV